VKKTMVAIGLGLLLAITAMFGVGFLNVVFAVPTNPYIAGALEGLAFFAGFALGMYLGLREPPRPTVSREEWGRPRR
jgi:hypothetical protein